jgi:hypothetical protein
VAYQAQLAPIALQALFVLALIAAGTGEIYQALELVGLPLCHRCSAYDTKSRASLLLADLEARTAPQEIESVKEKWSSMTIDHVVARFLGLNKKEGI